MTADCVEFCKALADDTRQRILTLLLEGEKNVGDLVKAFPMSQPTISHHLAVLRQLKLVSARKVGKQVFYAINRDMVVECCGMLMSKFDVTDCCP